MPVCLLSVNIYKDGESPQQGYRQKSKYDRGFNISLIDKTYKKYYALRYTWIVWQELTIISKLYCWGDVATTLQDSSMRSKLGIHIQNGASTPLPFIGAFSPHSTSANVVSCPSTEESRHTIKNDWGSSRWCWTKWWKDQLCTALQSFSSGGFWPALKQQSTTPALAPPSHPPEARQGPGCARI